MVRCFQNDDIHHVAGSIDPLRDIETITTELVLADLATLEKQKAAREKKARAGDAEARADLAVIDRLVPHLNQGSPALTLELSAVEARTA